MRVFDRAYGAIFSFSPTVKKLFVGMRGGSWLIVFIILIALLIAFGNRGLVDNYVMREKLAVLVRSNQEVAIENQQLKNNIVLLRSDLAYIEMIVRNELGMVRKGDLVYRYAPERH
jgi:cell division protein FtsB